MRIRLGKFLDKYVIPDENIKVMHSFIGTIFYEGKAETLMINVPINYKALRKCKVYIFSTTTNAKGESVLYIYVH